jgi:hypothetical protein
MAWQQVADRLRRAGTLTVTQFETGAPVTEDDVETLTAMRKALPPPPIMQFYRSCNGVKLLWDGRLGGRTLQGSVNIISMVRSSVRAPAGEEGEPLEGVLWDAEFEPQVLRDLKRMAIFEDIAGRSAYLTYIVGNPDGRLFLVEGDRVRPIVPDFATAVGLLQRYAGAEQLREYLTHSDWQARIDADDALGQIATL